MEQQLTFDEFQQSIRAKKNAKQREYYAKNIDKERARNREEYAKNREERLEYRKNYYNENKEKIYKKVKQACYSNWHCDVCDKDMLVSNKSNHLRTDRHKKAFELAQLN